MYLSGVGGAGFRSVAGLRLSVKDENQNIWRSKIQAVY
jgi:hypothetical protein